MSKLCDQVIKTVREIFPQVLIRTEEFVFYRNQKLFLDIYLPQLGIVIEVHGRQHDEFVEYFHGDAKGFRSSKKRDRMKEEWAHSKGFILVSIYEKDLPVTAESLLELIENAADL